MFFLNLVYYNYNYNYNYNYYYNYYYYYYYYYYYLQGAVSDAYACVGAEAILLSMEILSLVTSSNKTDFLSPRNYQVPLSPQLDWIWRSFTSFMVGLWHV